MYNKSLLPTDTWKIIDASGTFGHAAIFNTSLSTTAIDAYENRDINSGYNLDLVDKASQRRSTSRVVTISPKGVCISNLPEPRDVGLDVGDIWLDALNVVVTGKKLHEDLNFSYPTKSSGTLAWSVELKKAAYGLYFDPETNNYNGYKFPPVGDVLDYMLNLYGLNDQGILQSSFVFSKYNNGSTNPPGEFVPSYDTDGDRPVVPTRAPGVGEIWFFVSICSPNNYGLGSDGQGAGALFLRVKVDRTHANWRSLDLIVFGNNNPALDFLVAPNPSTVEIKAIVRSGDSAWRDVDSSITPVTGVTAPPSSYTDVPGRRALDDGFARHDVSVFDLKVLGFPEFCQSILLQGDVTVDAASKTITVARGIRQIEWFGSKLRDVVDLENEELSEQEIADIESFRTKRIRTAILPAKRTVPSNPLVSTSTYADSEEADINLAEEIFAEADLERELPAITFGQASKAAAGSVYNILHIIDDFGTVLDTDSKIFFNTITNDVRVITAGITVTLESFDDLWALVWGGATIIEEGDGPESFLSWLGAVTDTETSAVEYFDELDNGDFSEWNETTAWPRVLDPSKLDVSTLRAQEIVQFARKRDTLSQFISASITQGRLASRSFT
jgi:hypothetical protein